MGERFGSRAQIPTLDSLDEEFGRQDDEIAFKPDYGDRRLLPSILFFLGMAFLGVVLALIWHNIDPQLWFATQWSPNSAPRPTASTTGAGSAEQLIELDALKKKISELHDSQQQMAASIASLQAGQQELQQRSSFQSADWYSEPKILMYRSVTARQPSPAASPKPKSTTRSGSETPDANVARRDQGAPLPLVSARP